MIPSTWPSKDDIPDAFAEFVETGDIIELEDNSWKMADTAVEGMRPKEEVKKFRTNNINLEKDKLQLTEELEKLKSSQKGGMTAAEAERANREIQTLQDRLEAGESEVKVMEQLEKRMTKVEIGDREIQVAKIDVGHLKKTMKLAASEKSEASAREDRMLTELRTGAIQGGTLKAIAEIGGFQKNATPAIVDHVKQLFRMDADFRPYKPDPAFRSKNGEPPEALPSPDGKSNFSIKDELRAAMPDFVGVWTPSPGGPKNTARSRELTDPDAKVVGESRVARALENRA